MKGTSPLPEKVDTRKKRPVRTAFYSIFLAIWAIGLCALCYYIYHEVSTMDDETFKKLSFLWPEGLHKKPDPVPGNLEQIEQHLFRKKRATLSSPMGSGQQSNSRLYCDAITPCVHVCHDWFESYRSVDRACLERQPSPRIATTANPNVPDDACIKGQNPRPLIMGNSGGDPKSACENTFEATEAGLAAGMNGVKIDLSMSSEGTVFLWRDHLPGSLMSRIRQNGLMFVEKCKPMYLPRSFRPAHTLGWGQIRASWFYTDFSNTPQDANVPTLEDWVFNYGLNDQIEKVWLDVHCPEFLVDEILIRAWKVFDARGIANKLYYTLLSDGTIHFPKSLHLVGQVNLDKEVRLLSDQAFEQLSNLIVAPLKDSNTDVQVVTNEDFTFFSLLHKAVNNSKVDSTIDSKLGTPNVYLDLVDSEELPKRVLQLSNESSCPNVLTWVIDNPSQIEVLKCSSKNIEAIITNVVSKATQIQCKSDHVEKNQNQSQALPDVSPRDASSLLLNCDRPCGRILWPVCGSDGKIYPNECLLEIATCESRGKITLKTGGECEPPVFRLLQRQVQNAAPPEPQVPGFCEKVTSTCGSDTFIMDATICGSDGKLYENRCLFEKEVCSSKNTNLREVVNCVKNICNLVCSDDSRPVCGTDNLTYRNPCALVKMNCPDTGKNVRFFHYGPCGKCDAKCNDQNSLSPVCGSDGVTYQNKCFLYQTACQQNRPIVPVMEGKC